MQNSDDITEDIIYVTQLPKCPCVAFWYWQNFSTYNATITDPSKTQTQLSWNIDLPYFFAILAKTSRIGSNSASGSGVARDSGSPNMDAMLPQTHLTPSGSTALGCLCTHSNCHRCPLLHPAMNLTSWLPVTALVKSTLTTSDRSPVYVDRCHRQTLTTLTGEIQVDRVIPGKPLSW